MLRFQAFKLSGFQSFSLTGIQDSRLSVPRALRISGFILGVQDIRLSGF
jgi:hypothetical protein